MNKLILYLNFAILIVSVVVLFAFCFDLLEDVDERNVPDYSFLVGVSILASVCLYNISKEKKV